MNKVWTCSYGVSSFEMKFSKKRGDLSPYMSTFLYHRNQFKYDNASVCVLTFFCQ